MGLLAKYTTASAFLTAEAILKYNAREALVSYYRLDAALLIAARWHAGAFRDGDQTLPYVIHPMEVLVNLRHIGHVRDEDLLCAAVLHEVLVETTATRTEIEAAFGSRVSELVQALTPRQPSAEQSTELTKSQLWELRSSWLLEEIANMPPDALPIKLADRLSNIREARRANWPKDKRPYFDQTQKILELVPRSVNPALWDAVKTEIEH